VFEAETSNKILDMTSGWRKLHIDIKELNNAVRVMVKFSGFGGLEVA
jgi:hypothetical protein